MGGVFFSARHGLLLVNKSQHDTPPFSFPFRTRLSAAVPIRVTLSVLSSLTSSPERRCTPQPGCIEDHKTQRRKLNGKVFTTRTFLGSRVGSPVSSNNGPPKTPEKATESRELWVTAACRHSPGHSGQACCQRRSKSAALSDPLQLRCSTSGQRAAGARTHR